MQLPWPGTRVPVEKSLEVLREVLMGNHWKCSWGCSEKSGCSGGCSEGAQGNRGVLCVGALPVEPPPHWAPSKALPGAPPASRSTLGSTSPQHKASTERHCQKFQALCEGILADVRYCLKLWAGRKWPAHRPFDIGEARSREAFLHAALADKLSDNHTK